MRKVKCPGCGKLLELPAAFSGIITCPECQGRLPVFEGRETRKCPCCSETVLFETTRCWKCGGQLEKTPVGAGSGSSVPSPAPSAPPPPEVKASINQDATISYPGVISGLVFAAFGFFSGPWSTFLIPVGLLVAGVSAFSGIRYSCSACGTRLAHADLKICPVCKSRLDS